MIHTHFIIQNQEPLLIYAIRTGNVECAKVLLKSSNIKVHAVDRMLRYHPGSLQGVR